MFVIHYLNIFHLLAQKPNLEKCSTYSNKFFHNFHLSESSFTCPGLQASELVQRMVFVFVLVFNLWEVGLVYTTFNVIKSLFNLFFNYYFTFNFFSNKKNLTFGYKLAMLEVLIDLISDILSINLHIFVISIDQIVHHLKGDNL